MSIGIGLGLAVGRGGAAASVRASESFDVADGTLITALSLPWTKNAGLSGNTNAPAIDNGAAHGENAATVSFYTREDWTPATPNYRVEAGIVARSLANGAGIVGRVVGSTYYLFMYTGGVGWRLFRTGVQLGSTVAVGLTLGQVYSAALVMEGDQISGEVDGVRIVTATDANITAAGKAGMRFQSAATSATGIHIDYWRVVQ